MKEHRKSKKIKVGIFVDGDFIPSYDGAANRFHYLSRYLQESGVEVIIFHGFRGWSDLKLIAKESFKTCVFPVQQYYNNLDLIASIIKREGIDIIQFDNLEPILLQGLKLSYLTQTHLVSEMHYVVRNLAKSLGASKERIKTIKKTETVVGQAIDHLICLSSDDKLPLIKNMGLSNNRISVIPSGVDTSEIRFWGPNLKEKVILFLGNLFFEPNAEAVEIIYKYLYPKLSKFGFRFLIVGDCPRKLKAKYQKSGFKFTGVVKDLNTVFNKATFAVAPILEGTGLRIKILNYLAAGIPVITTRAATSGFINKNNFVLEDDFKQYPELILKLINAKKETWELAQKSRTMVEKEYNWLIIAQQTESVYQKIINRKLKDKSLLLPQLSNFSIKEPVWLEEAKEKGRFSEAKYPINKKFTYAIVSCGKINYRK